MSEFQKYLQMIQESVGNYDKLLIQDFEHIATAILKVIGFDVSLKPYELEKHINYAIVIYKSGPLFEDPKYVDPRYKEFESKYPGIFDGLHKELYEGSRLDRTPYGSLTDKRLYWLLRKAINKAKLNSGLSV